jgi:hypothetical protein
VRLDQKPEIGTIVHLRPKTKTCGRACLAYRAAKVLSYKRLPMVLVDVQYREDEPHTDGDWVTVHLDCIGLHPAKGKATVDMAGSDLSTSSQRGLGPKPKPIDLPPGWSEEPLF